jgi:8-oxo-dGTP diphosphatase
MAVHGIPYAPGTARGIARIAASTGAWSAGAARPCIAVVSAARWPPGPEDVTGVAGVVVDGRLRRESGRPVGVPVVSEVPADLFHDGDRLEVDGTRGEVRLFDVQEFEVVTAFLEDADGRILLLHRSHQVGTFQGLWAGVSGYIEEPTARAQAFREILEETGLGPDAVRLEREGLPVPVRDGIRLFLVHPFRFRVGTHAVRLDWEHTEAEWVVPAEMGGRPTVPKLAAAWAAVAEGALQNNNSRS